MAIKHEKCRSGGGTLCWRCDRIVGCSWMQELKPVKGWTAEERTVKYSSSGRTVVKPSYHVKKCPLFRAREEK